MDLTFDYYHNLDDVDLYLCNPDGRELFALNATDRAVTLRFNSLSELSFTVDSKIPSASGDVIDAPYYDYVEVKRLIHVSNNIGWFQINSVSESDDGVHKTKSVKAESIECMLKNIGFLMEERVYKFYDALDPYDDTYDADDPGSVPSVVGQLCRQLGFTIDLGGANAPYEDWTITAISGALVFNIAEPICRTFQEGTVFAYEFLANQVQDAFGIVTIFDIENKTVQFKTVADVTKLSDVCLSFDNVIENMDISEDASNITTVLNCTGDSIDITTVNPMGTNYIVNFDYYMDEVNHRWMSQPLIDAIKSWKTNYVSKKNIYKALVQHLYNQNKNARQLEAVLQEKKIFSEDLNRAAGKLVESTVTGGELSGIIKAEQIPIATEWKAANTSFTLATNDDYLWGYSEITSADTRVKRVLAQPVPIISKEKLGTGTITSIQDMYLATNESTNVTTATAGWSTTVSSALFDSTRRFIWHYRRINNSVNTEPEIICTYHDVEEIVNEDGTTTTYPAFATSPSIYNYYCVSTKQSGVYAFPFKTAAATSYFVNNSLLNTTVIPAAYNKPPTYNAATKTFSYSGTTATVVQNKTVAQLFAEVASDIQWQTNEKITTAHLYFLEPPISGTNPGDGGKSYFVLTGEAKKVPDTSNTLGYHFEYVCNGATRYAAYDNVNAWWNGNESQVKILEDLLLFANSNIRSASKYMNNIANSLNIRNYIKAQANGARLLRELQCYWIESSFQNSNISEVDNSDFTDSLMLASQLLESGEEALVKASQPSYSFTISARAAHKCYALSEFVKRLKLGCVSVIERGDDDWFYPALLEMSFSLDGDNFSLAFANSTRLTDYNYTVAELMTSAASVSRQVSANWSALNSYSEDKEEIQPAVLDPMNAALRAAKSALANVGNQEFQVDSNGILGRRRTADGEEFSDEQIRIINNIIAFTNDKWENVKTALGNITLTETDRAGNTTQTNAYGLVADAIVGSLIIGNTLRINNNDNSIVIDKNGISITTGNNQQTFKATNDGDLYLSGRADVSGNIEGDKVVTNLIESRTGETSIKLNADASGARELTAFLTASLENLHPKFTIVIKNASGNLQQITSSREFAIRYEDGYGASHAITCRVPSGANGAYIVEPEFQTMFVRNAVFMDSTSDELTFNDNGGSVDTTYTATLSYHNLTGGYQELDIVLTAGVGAVELQREMTFYVQYQDEFGTWKSTICRMMPGDVNYTMELGTDPRIVDYRFWSISSAYTITPNTNGRQATFVQTVQLDTSVGVEIKGSLLPNSGTNYDIGSSSKKWNNIYAKTGTIQTSARASKVDISDLDDSHNDELFDNLRPRKFKMADGTSGRTHYGFILDELGDAIEASGLTPEECAAYCLQDVEDPNGLGGIRYSEFIALNTLQIQKLKARIAELEEQCKK